MFVRSGINLLMRITAPQLKLIHKGLLLIAVPLLFGLVFVLIFQSVVQTYRLVRSKNAFGSRVAVHINDVNEKLLQVEKAWRYGDSKSRLHQPLDDCSSSIASLSDAMYRYPRRKYLIFGLNADIQLPKSANPRLSDFSVGNLKTVTEDWSALKAALLNSSSGADVNAALMTLRSSINSLETYELWWSGNADEKADEADQLLQNIIGVGISINIIVCAFLVLQFSHGLVRRLNILTENSERFAHSRDLLPATGGHDEIAQVDAMFHSMASKVKQSEQAQRDFIAMINHDVRTPLNAVEATLTLVSEGIYGQLNEQGLERVTRAEKSTREIILLINQLLDLEKVRSGRFELKMRPVNLTEISRNAADTVRGIAEFKDIEIQISESNSGVLADPVRINQVMLNLLANSVKFGPIGSRVKVDFEPLSNDQTQVSVSDEGDGVPSDIADNVFEKFWQGPADGHSAEYIGSGLGLAICKQIIEAHGGTIGVSNRHTGKGSIFWFRLRTATATAEVSSN